MPSAVGGNATRLARRVPPAWQFVLLSLLLHVWVITLFGDAGGGRGDAAGWASTFSARLQSAGEGAVRGRTGVSAASSSSAWTRTESETSTGALPDSAAPAAVSAPAAAENAERRDEASIETALPPLPVIDKIPALTQEMANQTSPLTPSGAAPSIVPRIVPSIAPITIAPLSVAPAVEQSSGPDAQQPLAARTSSATSPTVAPLTVAPLAAPSSSASFTIAIPVIADQPIVAPVATQGIAVLPLPPLPAPPNVSTSAAMSPSATPLLVAPIVLPALPTPQVGDLGANTQRTLTAPPIVPLALRPIEVPAAQALAPQNLQVPSLTIPAIELPQSTRAPAIVQSIDIPVVAPAPKALQEAVTDAPTGARAEAAPTVRPETGASRRAGSANDTLSGTATATRSVPQPESAQGAGAGQPALLNAPMLPPPSAGSRTLDLDALRRQARDLSREGAGNAGRSALLPFPALPKEASKRDIEKAFDKALKRPDCNEAYRDMGLAAVIPLVRDALRDDGCRWQSAPQSSAEKAPPATR